MQGLPSRYTGEFPIELFEGSQILNRQLEECHGFYPGQRRAYP